MQLYNLHHNSLNEPTLAAICAGNLDRLLGLIRADYPEHDMNCTGIVGLDYSFNGNSAITMLTYLYGI